MFNSKLGMMIRKHDRILSISESNSITEGNFVKGKNHDSEKGRIVSQFEAPFSEAYSINLFRIDVAPSRDALLEEVIENFK